MSNGKHQEKEIQSSHHPFRTRKLPSILSNVPANAVVSSEKAGGKGGLENGSDEGVAKKTLKTKIPTKKEKKQAINCMQRPQAILMHH